MISSAMSGPKGFPGLGVCACHPAQIRTSPVGSGSFVFLRLSCAQGILAFWFTTRNCKKSKAHQPPCSTLPRAVPGGTKVSALTGAQRTSTGSQRDRAGFHSKPSALHLVIRASPSSTQTVLGKTCEGTHVFVFAYLSQQNQFQAPRAIVAKFSATGAKPHHQSRTKRSSWF